MHEFHFWNVKDQTFHILRPILAQMYTIWRWSGPFWYYTFRTNVDFLNVNAFYLGTLLCEEVFLVFCSCIFTSFVSYHLYLLYRQSSAYTVYFGTPICPFSTRSLLRLNGCFSKVSKNSVSKGPSVHIMNWKKIVKTRVNLHKNALSLYCLNHKPSICAYSDKVAQKNS